MLKLLVPLSFSGRCLVPLDIMVNCITYWAQFVLFIPIFDDKYIFVLTIYAEAFVLSMVVAYGRQLKRTHIEQKYLRLWNLSIVSRITTR